MKNSADRRGCYPQSKVCAILVFTTKTTQPRPQVFLVNGALTCRRPHFWRHFLVKHKILPNLVNYACAFSQSELGKYFELTINIYIYTVTLWIAHLKAMRDSEADKAVHTCCFSWSWVLIQTFKTLLSVAMHVKTKMVLCFICQNLKYW